MISKKIDSDQFKENEAHLWDAWKVLFEQVHPKSFTAQKLYLINAIRRKYPYQEKTVISKVMPKEKQASPKRRPLKLKIVTAKPVLKKPKTD